MYKKNIKTLILFSLVSFLFQTGLESVNIPESSKGLALLNSGSASSDDPQINLASLASNDNSYVSFSIQNWIGGISGSQLLFVLPNNPMLFSVRSIALNDIEVRNEVPSTHPIGYTGARMLDCGLGYGYKNSLASMAFLVRANYISLYTYKTYGVLFDFSIQKNLNNFSKVSFNMKNLGYQKFNNLDGSIPIQIQFGSSFNLPFYFKANFDAINTVDRGTDLVASIEYNLGFINLLLSASSGYLGNNYGAGFELEYYNWKVSYGLMIHELSHYNMPYFLDLSYSLNK